MAHRFPALRAVPGPRPRPAEPTGVRTVGAVEVLPGRIRAALLDGSGTVLRRAEAGFGAAGRPGDPLDAALARATGILAGRDLAGVAVAAAGLVDPATGVVVGVDEAPELDGYPVADRLRARTGAPVLVEHRARLQVLGDRWFGAGRGRSAFASVSTGEVLGVGLLHAGEVLAPNGGRSGAHMTVAATAERCTCGGTGCWKAVATTGWLRAAASAAGLGPVASLGDLAGRDDPAARALLERYAHHLALGLANVQQLFAPGLFVLHGEAAQGGERYRRLVERLLRRDGARSGGERPAVVVGGAAGDDAALLGGAGLVLSAGRYGTGVPRGPMFH